MSVVRGKPNIRKRIYLQRFLALSFLVMGILLAGSFLVQETYRAYAGSRDVLRVWFFDIGQGDAIFIETPTGEQILVDAGRDASILSKLGSVMWPWDRTIDAIVLTHPDADHIGGFPSVLERYHVETIYESGARSTTNIYESFAALREEEQSVQKVLTTGSTIEIGEVILTTIWPRDIQPGEVLENKNDASIVLLLTYGETTVLLTGDAEEESEAHVSALVGDIDVLKVGHHGSKTSSSYGFLQTINPEEAVISAGRENRYGHPHEIVLHRLKDLGIDVLRTDEDGDILLLSTGGEPEVFPAPLPF